MIAASCAILLLGLSALASGEDAMVAEFRKIQADTRHFNETVMTPLYPVIESIPALKKHSYILFRGMSRVYAPFLWNVTSKVDMLIIGEYGKWYFTEDKQFLEDQIVPHVTEPAQMQMIQKVRDGLDDLKNKCIRFVVVYGGISAVEAFIPTNLQPFVVSVHSMLSNTAVYETIYKFLGAQ